MKVVINDGYGGFGLSHKAVMRYAKLKGIKLYPYIDDITKKIYGNRATFNNPDILVHYFTIPPEDKETINKHSFLPAFDIKRNDPQLIQVVKEMGKKAEAKYSNLKIIEIPDNIEWVIEHDDKGNEWIAEKHRTWR